MTNACEYITKKYGLKIGSRSELPIKIPEKTRADLVELYFEFGFKVGAEIGVERGIFSEQICLKNPESKLFCIDAWKMYDNNQGYRSQSQLDAYYSQAKERLSSYNCEIIKSSSIDAAKTFAPESLDFVYLDANHNFDYVMNDIIEWSGKVRVGGIVSGHDYVANNLSHTVRYGVIEATNAYTKAHGINPWFVLNGERSANWFWIKP